MGKGNREFREKLLATFEVEAAEHIQALSLGLIELEKADPRQRGEVLEVIFREAHSLKGAARAVSVTEMEAICQSLESHFSALRGKEADLSPGLFDLLHEAVDTLAKLVPQAGSGPAVAAGTHLQDLIRRLEHGGKAARGQARQQPPVTSGESPAAGRPGSGPPAALPSAPLKVAGEEKPLTAQTVRISAAKLDALLRQAEELLSVKQAASLRAVELQGALEALDAIRNQWTQVRPEIRVLEESLQGNGSSGRSRPVLAPPDMAQENHDPSLPHHRQSDLGVPAAPAALPAAWLRTSRASRNLAEFLASNEGAIKSLHGRLAALAKSAEQDQRAMSGMVDGLLEDMKKALMLPFFSLLGVFPKFVRDLSRDRGKEVDLVIQGGEIEADRRILEEMKDPLLHLIRNSIDHGIETPAKREAKGKPASGRITLAVAQRNGSKVEIVIADDGDGLDRTQLRVSARKLGVLSAEEIERLDEHQALLLAFQSGVSTSPMITDISGRGLGLAIVREKVEKLGGTVAVESTPGQGTTFRIILPLTLAAFRGIQVRAGEHFFVFPTTYVERVIRVAREEIETVENRETIPLNGAAVALVRLGDALELPRSGDAKPGDKVPVVVLSSGEKRIAFRVDEICDEQEVLVKSFNPQLSRVRNIAGATGLGTGRVVPIVNVPDLMKSAVRLGRAPAPLPPLQPEAPEKRKAVLIAEDSITARTLLKSILESAGFSVTAAVDGVDAFTALRGGQFDLVVSDVDMPRMNGFDLTAKIRGDKKLAELPVVLVTALESREDRERGIDVGADAYIVKSSFDQSNLLEVIRRLV